MWGRRRWREDDIWWAVNYDGCRGAARDCFIHWAEHGGGVDNTDSPRCDACGPSSFFGFFTVVFVYN